MAVSTIATIPALRDVYTQLKTRMDKAVEDFRTNMAAARTGRASVHMLDTVRVPYYGSEMPINQVANVHVPEPQLITVQPFDPSIMAEIEKAIRAAGQGLNPQNDGKLIRVPVPPLTEERRRDLVKHTRKLAEDYRVSVRNHRRDSLELLKELEKEKDITEDDRRHAAEKVEALSKEYVERMDKVLKGKEDEI